MKKQNDNSVYSENRLGRAGQKHRGAKSVAIVAGLLAAMAAVMYLTAVVCMWIDKKMQDDANDAAIALGLKDENGNDLDVDGNIIDKDGNIISAASERIVYSQAELDARVSEAAAAAAAAAGQQASEEVLNQIRSSLDQGDSVLEALRPLYPDHLIVYSGKKYNFVPINRELKLNDYIMENLSILETGEFQYLRDGQVISHKGIDVSQYQGAIDWKKVAEDGVEFAFLRVGYRGYGTGRLVTDGSFDANIKGALDNGIKVGVYIYSQAVNEAEALEEANLVLEKIAPYTVECPVVFDVERVAEDPEARMNLLSRQDRTRMAKVFCQAVEAAGYRPMIYHNTETGAMMLDLPELEEYDKWFAAYTDRFYYPYAYNVWQYSQTGSVSGIQGAVDLNISFGPLWE